jgi:hypothetical protein
MIYTVLKGGLGNQLFQFGAALRLAKGDIDLIRFAFNDGPDRPYRLSELFDNRFLPKLISDDEIVKIQKEAESLIFINDQIFGEFIDCPILDESLIESRDYLLDGYFQSGKNLMALKKYLESDSSIYKVSKSYGYTKSLDLIAHYRLGDYARSDVQKNIGLINAGYLDGIISQYISIGKKVTVFTDDPIFKEKYSHLSNLTVICGGDDIEVFNTLLNAETLIAANSTFSLCAGLLSGVNRILYRPAFWTRNLLSDDLCLGFEGKDIRWTPNSFY